LVRETKAAAFTPILPPASVPLEKADLPFFHAIIDEFTRAEWSDHQLQVAAMLARIMHEMVLDQIRLREEGPVTISARGLPMPNPLKTSIQQGASTIISLRRTLSLQANSHADSRTLTRERAARKNIEGTLVEDAEEEDLDSLLAGSND
jgi:hypothetical protein